MPNMFWLSFNISQMMNDAETDEIRFKFPKWTKSYINGVIDLYLGYISKFM